MGHAKRKQLRGLDAMEGFASDRKSKGRRKGAGKREAGVSKEKRGGSAGAGEQDPINQEQGRTTWEGGGRKPTPTVYMTPPWR